MSSIKTHRALITMGALMILAIGGYALLSIKRQVELLQQLAVRFLGAKVLNVSLDSVGLTIYLEIKNISDLEVYVDSVDMAVSLDGIDVNRVMQNKRQVIPPQGSGKVQFDLHFKPMEVLGNIKISDILQAFDYKNIKMRLVGIVSGSINGIPFSKQPFDISQTIGDLITSGTQETPSNSQ